MSLTDLQIQATICPTSLRWPNSNVAFEKLKLAVDELRALARGCDDACRTVEVDGDLTPEGVQRPSWQAFRTSTAPRNRSARTSNHWKSGWSICQLLPPA